MRKAYLASSPVHFTKRFERKRRRDRFLRLGLSGGAPTLTEQRQQVWSDMEQIVNSSTDQWTPETETRYAELEGQYQRLSNQIASEERFAALSRPGGPPVVTNPGAEPETEQRAAEYATAFDAYLRGRASSEQRSFLETESREQSVGTPSEGGYTVPVTVRDKLIEVRQKFGGIAAAVEEFTTSGGNEIKYPTIDDTANEADITAEGAAFTGGADIVFGEVSLKGYKYTTLGAGDAPLKVTVELLQDSQFDIGALIARVFGRRIARRQAKDWAAGAGTTEPLGLSTTTVDVTGVDATADLTYAKLLALEEALDEEYRDGASFVMNPAAWFAVRALTDTAGGRPLILPQAGAGIAGAVPKQLLGYPVILDPSMPAPAVDVVSVVFGNIKEAYVIRRINGTTVIVDPYTAAATGHVCYTAWERADGTIQNRNAMVTMGDPPA